MGKPFLHEVMSDLADELAELLRKNGEAQLAEQVSRLQLIDRCRCGDDFCSTIYTAPKPIGAWNKNHETISLDPDEGYMIIGVIDGNIVEVEILFRDRVRDDLLQLLP